MIPNTHKIVKQLQMVAEQISEEVTREAVFTYPEGINYKKFIKQCIEKVNQLSLDSKPAKDYIKGYCIILLSAAELGKQELYTELYN